jgi:hypothetical protein
MEFVAGIRSTVRGMERTDFSAVGDGAMVAFGAEMLARMPEEHRARATELDEAEMRGEGTEAEALEAFGLFWPSYFADPGAAPPIPPMRISLPVQAEMFPDITAQLPALERALSDVAVPLGVVVGALSPMPPQEAGLDSAALVPGAWGSTSRAPATSSGTRRPAASSRPWSD